MAKVTEPEKAPRKPTFLENTLLGTTYNKIPSLIPGVLLAAVVFVIAFYIAKGINSASGFSGLISYILLAIVIGLLVRNTVGLHPVFSPGVSFCLRKLLRMGIIMMGIRLSIMDVLKIGGFGIPIVIACIFAGLLIATYVTRWLKLPERLGTLIAIGTGICGVSAIVATAPGIQAKDEEVTYAVANITIFGILATFLYPYLSNLLFGGDVTMAGLFMGTAIHDTAQVTSASLIYDQTFNVTVRPSAADIAVTTKLVRNSLMIFAIPGITYFYVRRMRALGQTPKGQKFSFLTLIPLFVFGFLAMAIIRSIGDWGLNGGHNAYGLWDASGWKALTGGIKTWSSYIIATAAAGVGMSTSLRTMRGLGLKPFLVGILAAVSVGVVSTILVFVLGPHVSV